MMWPWKGLCWFLEVGIHVYKHAVVPLKFNHFYAWDSKCSRCVFQGEFFFSVTHVGMSLAAAGEGRVSF